MPAYGPKYRIEIGCIDGGSGTTETYRLDIEESGYASSVTDLDSSTSPIRINYPGGAHYLAPIRPSEILIEIVVASEAQATTLYNDFATFDEQEYLVKLYNNTNQLRWTGWLDNSYGYVEDLSMVAPKIVTLKAIDGVGLLQRKEFRDSAGDLWDVRKSAHDIIQLGLEEYWPDTTAGSFLTYGMLLNAEDDITDWTGNTPEDAKNPLKTQFWDMTYFMADERNPMSWFDVFRIILRNNFMYMTNGFTTHGWPVFMCFLRNITSTTGEDLTLLNYDNLDGSYNSADANKWTTTLNDVTGTDIDNKFIGTKATFSKPVKYIDVTRERVNPNLVVGGNFENDVWVNSTTLSVDYFESINGPTVAKTAETEEFSENSLAFTNLSTDKSAGANGVRSLQGYAPNKVTSSLSITFSYNITVSSTTPQTDGLVPEMGIAFICGGRYLQDDLETWEAVENVLWLKIPGDSLNFGWITETLGIPSAPSPAGEVFFEVYAPIENSYTVTAFKWDQIHVLDYYNQTTAAGIETYNDIESSATNGDITSDERRSIVLNIMEYPKITVQDLTSAVYNSTVIEFGGDTYTDTADFTIVLDGSGKTYTYRDSPGATGSGEWGGSAQTATQKIDDLILEIYYDTNNYLCTNQAGVSGRELVITALQYGDEIGAVTYDAQATSDGWNDTETAHVDPTTVETFISKATITDDASGTDVYTPKWYFHDESEPSSFDSHHWKIIAKKYLEHYEVGTEEIEGIFKVFNEGTDQFGALIGVDVDGGSENLYQFVQGDCNLKMLEWGGTWRKHKSSTVTTVTYTDKEVPDAQFNNILRNNSRLERREGLPVGYTKGNPGIDNSFGGD